MLAKFTRSRLHPLPLVAALGLVALSCDMQPPHNVAQSNNAMYGGTEVTQSELNSSPFGRWQFSGGDWDGGDCAAVLIARNAADTKYAALTAGHCAVCPAIWCDTSAPTGVDPEPNQGTFKGTLSGYGTLVDVPYCESGTPEGDDLGLFTVSPTNTPNWPLASVTHDWDHANQSLISIDFDDDYTGQSAAPDPQRDTISSLLGHNDCDNDNHDRTFSAVLDNAHWDWFDSGAITYFGTLSAPTVTGILYADDAGETGNRNIGYMLMPKGNPTGADETLDNVLEYLSNQGTIIQKYHCQSNCADFNLDGKVDGDDYSSMTYMASGATKGDGDADCDGDVDSADVAIWVSQEGDCYVEARPGFDVYSRRCYSPDIPGGSPGTLSTEGYCQYQ